MTRVKNRQQHYRPQFLGDVRHCRRWAYAPRKFRARSVPALIYASYKRNRRDTSSSALLSTFGCATKASYRRIAQGLQSSDLADYTKAPCYR